MGDNLLRTGGANPAPTADPLTRAVDSGPARHGVPGMSKVRTGLFRYDRWQGLGRGGLSIGVETADRMPREEAADALQKIHRIHGVEHSMEHVLAAHDGAMFVCYAFNGASQLGPFERASFFIKDTEGTVSSFEFNTVHQVLGVNMRRFFRAFANEVVQSCRYLYDHCDLEDERMVDLRAHMLTLADKRGVSRFPWLIADCSEAATDLNPSEKAAALTSKSFVVGNTANSVDRRNLAKPVRSADNYDSSTGVAHATDIHGGGGPSAQYYA